MSWLSSILIALAGISFALGLWQWLAGRRFPIWKPEHTDSQFLPALSILKPLKGCDSETERCLESWFTQQYTNGMQLLFGVASPEDPVCDVVRRLIAKYPERTAELVITQPLLGANAKVSSLCHLAARAAHKHLIISDADVVIRPDFYRELLGPLENESIGIVNCFYIQAGAQTVPMRLEAVAGNADFWTHVLQAIALKPMDFALGAVMATRKSEVAKIGGFEALIEYLADDYELGHRIARSGKDLRICTIPVECRSAPYGWRDVWEHQVRWGRTIRVCRPVAYFFSILGNGTVWPLLAFFTAGPGIGWIFLAILAGRVIAAMANYARFTRRCPWWVAPLTPIQDIGQALVWIVSFMGNTIVWRGEPYRVHASGKLTPLA